jgi:hypothetical protein
MATRQSSCAEKVPALSELPESVNSVTSEVESWSQSIVKDFGICWNRAHHPSSLIESNESA